MGMRLLCCLNPRSGRTGSETPASLGNIACPLLRRAAAAPGALLPVAQWGLPPRLHLQGAALRLSEALRLGRKEGCTTAGCATREVQGAWRDVVPVRCRSCWAGRQRSCQRPFPAGRFTHGPPLVVATAGRGQESPSTMGAVRCPMQLRAWRQQNALYKWIDQTQQLEAHLGSMQGTLLEVSSVIRSPGGTPLSSRLSGAS